MKFDKPVMRSEVDNKIIIDKDQVPALVYEWIGLIETETTERMCKCAWMIHPEDTDVPENCCRICSAPRDSQMHLYDEEGSHPFKGRRKVRNGSEHPECPIHTKSGLILGFLKWALETKNGG